MRRFSGAGGSLYALGERLAFTDQPLVDCGDGWDWRAPEELSYWIEDPVITVVRAGEMIQTGTVETFLSTGRIGLPCNMSCGAVLASGVCLPTSLIGSGTRWEINVSAIVPEVTSLGDDSTRTNAVIGATTAVLYGVVGAVVPIQNVLARFPVGIGVFTGIGSVTCHGANSHIDFSEGVKYDHR